MIQAVPPLFRLSMSLDILAGSFIGFNEDDVSFCAGPTRRSSVMNCMSSEGTRDSWPWGPRSSPRQKLLQQIFKRKQTPAFKRSLSIDQLTIDDVVRMLERFNESQVRRWAFGALAGFLYLSYTIVLYSFGFCHSQSEYGTFSDMMRLFVSGRKRFLRAWSRACLMSNSSSPDILKESFRKSQLYCLVSPFWPRALWWCFVNETLRAANNPAFIVHCMGIAICANWFFKCIFLGMRDFLETVYVYVWMGEIVRSCKLWMKEHRLMTSVLFRGLWYICRFTDQTSIGFVPDTWNCPALRFGCSAESAGL